MIEQEIASIIKFVLDCAGNPTPYYHNVPESFAVPSIFFSVPEIEYEADTLNSYGSNYTIFINFFHSTTEGAYELTLPVFHGINSNRKLIPLIDIEGETTGEFVRIKNSQLKKVDECAYQLQLDWVSRRPFTQSDMELVQEFYLNGGKL